jgi:anti-anti-sigma factor
MTREESPRIATPRPARTRAAGNAPAVVWLEGEHDASTKLAVAAAIDNACESDTDVIVDLSGVTFMDASIVGTLVIARNWLGARGVSLEVRSPSEALLNVLELCGLAELFAIPSTAMPPTRQAVG